jgi:hypothetical protein
LRFGSITTEHHLAATGLILKLFMISALSIITLPFKPILTLSFPSCRCRRNVI